MVVVSCQLSGGASIDLNAIRVIITTSAEGVIEELILSTSIAFIGSDQLKIENGRSKIRNVQFAILNSQRDRTTIIATRTLNTPNAPSRIEAHRS